MEQELKTYKSTEIKLSLDDEAYIKGEIKQIKQRNKRARRKYEAAWNESQRYYDQVPEYEMDEGLEWMANEVLAWGHETIETSWAHLHSTIMPRNDKFQEISGRTDEDAKGADIMQQGIEFKLGQARFSDAFGAGLKQYLIKGHNVRKVYWKRDEEIYHKDGQEQRREAYNSLYVDNIDIENFYFFPIYGAFEKTNRVHETYRFKDELLDRADQGKEWFNMDRVKAKVDKGPDTAPEYQLDEAEKQNKTPLGLKVDEAWFYRIKLPSGKVLYNYMATCVDEDTLIRFKPNSYPIGKSPFVWSCFNPDGDCLYGYPLLKPGIPSLGQATFLTNQRINELLLKMHPPAAYWDDGEYDPYNVIYRPGAMIKMSQDGVTLGNVRPIHQDLQHIVLNYTEIAELKEEFESVTVPKVAKGQTVRASMTATENKNTTQASNTRMHAHAYRINEHDLKPTLELCYLLYHERLDADPTLKVELARLTQPSVTTEVVNGQETEIRLSDQQLLERLPAPLPLPEIDIKLVGYQNQIAKQEQLEGMSIFLNQYGQSPGAKYLKWLEIGEDALRNLDLDRQRLLSTEDEKKQLDDQEQQQQGMQQQLLMAQEQAKTEAEQAKIQTELLDRQIELKRLENQELELTLKYGLEEAKLDRQDMQAAMMPQPTQPEAMPGVV